MPAASFQPQTIDLSASFVQLIRTALSFPKVTFDKTGLKSYDASGNLVLAINADGSASFTGSVTLPAGTTGAPASQSAVQWTRAGGGLVGEVYGAEVAGGDFLSLRAIATGIANETQAFLRATDGVGNSDLSVSRKPSNTVASGNYGATVATDAGIRKIFDDVGQSHFLQLLTALDLTLTGQFDTGVSGLIAQGAESVSPAIPHGLGRTPTAVWGNLYDGSWSSLCTWRAAVDAVNVTVHIGNAGQPAGATAGLKFHAIG